MANAVLQKALKTDLKPSPPTDLMPGLEKQQKEARQAEMEASSAVSALEEQKIKAETEAKAAQAQQRLEATESAEGRRKTRDEPLLTQEKELGEAMMKAHFEPSKENLADQAALFSLINVIGFAIGAGGKQNAQAAMAAMNGMLEGHQQGRADVFREERATFDKNLKALQQRAAFVEKELAKSLQEYTRDKDAGLQRADVAFAQAQADFMKTYAQKNGLVKAYEMAKEVRKNLDKAVEKEQARQLRIEDNARRDYEHRQLILATQQPKVPKEAKPEKEKRQTAAEIAAGFGTGPSALVEQFIGDRLPTKQAEPIINAAAAIGEADELKKAVKESPGIVGREGQIRQFVDRYIKSAMSGKGDLPQGEEFGADPKAQEALRFAKRYASYLVNYERSLAPGSRGFTVYFQRRFNDLMSQDQFNAPGMIGLLDDQQKEVLTQATRISGKANMENMKRLGHDIVARGVSETPSAPPPSSSEKTPESVVVGGKTYTRPANFSDQQWSDYKKAVGAK